MIDYWFAVIAPLKADFPILHSVTSLYALCDVSADGQYRHLVDDELLRFFDHCHGYVEGVEKNRTALQDVEKFKHGEEMEALRRRTARRLGLHHEFLTTGQWRRADSALRC